MHTPETAESLPLSFTTNPTFDAVENRDLPLTEIRRAEDRLPGALVRDSCAVGTDGAGLWRGGHGRRLLRDCRCGCVARRR